jgi:GTP-binding protein
MPAVFLKSVPRAADLPESSKPQIAMLGRSNVGKSSLINHLAGTGKLARVSVTPGLTRTINLYDFDGRYLLVDLPGYGYSRTAGSREGRFEGMLGEYLSEANQLKLVLLVIDGRHGFQESDRHVLNQMTDVGLPVVVVLNKTDKLSKAEAARALRDVKDEYPNARCLSHSTASTEGLGELRDIIEKTVRGAAG